MRWKSFGKRTVQSLAWCLLAGVILAQTGCLLVVAGAAGAGAAAGYVYLRGVLYRDYAANLGDCAAAVRTSLMELRFPVLDEKPGTGEVIITTRTADGTNVRIRLETVANPIPVEGTSTRIGVRVGFAGDEAVSARILDQISMHLVSPGQLPGSVAPPSTAVVPTSTTSGTAPLVPVPASPAAIAAPPAPPQTPPPPLADAAPPAKRTP